MQGKRGTGHRKVFKAFQVIAFVMLIAIPTMTAFSSETVLKTSSKEFLAKVLVLDRTVEKHPLDLGVYTSGPLQTTAQELGQIDAWMESQGLASRVQIAGTFMDIEFPNPAYNVIRDLDAAWDQGTAPFVNLAIGTTDVGPRSAAQVANGEIDAAIRTWAAVFSQWSQGGAKRAYIAPLQEMNADWVSYGLDPENYIAAYTRIQRIFNEEGVTAEAVTWVFAPNGWSMPEHAFENYYPAEARVDMIAFSGFNFGACADNIDPWQEYAECGSDPALRASHAGHGAREAHPGGADRECDRRR